MHSRNCPPKKILIINTFGVGDVLFTTPLISNLKANDPDVYIGYICNRRTEALLERNPKVNRIFVYERDEFNAVYQRSKIALVKKFRQFLKEVQNDRFDLVIDVSLSRGTGFLTWMIGIKQRIGYNYKHRSLFLNKRIPLKGYEEKHVVEYYLSLLEELGWEVRSKDLELTLNEDDLKWAESFMSSNQTFSNGNPVIGLVPGGGASWGKESAYKRWPAEKYAKLADKLIEKFSAATILMGDKNELALCTKVSQAMSHKPVMACGETTINQFAALAQKCSLMIVNDGGPLHIAAAAGVQTVSIFGPVDENVYGPYPIGNHIVVKKEIACQPCYRRFRKAKCEHISCLNQLTVEEVLERIKEAL
ncbi:MAG: lipopolysaccharide heptosyltransferase II [Candidatus Omnitrophica bacterium]|nr:lipopolysaccharide heptosyltransferase II [Candidatus Omnitrophota bacterium]MCK5259747.1 lipopolysaccharide heptosyltransferase II [Candidatus Omnitrophota bacterium]